MVKLYLIAPKKEELLEGNPYSLLYLGEWVRRHAGASVEIVQSPEQIKEKDAYVAISVTTPTYQKGLGLAGKLKQKSPDIKTILGGYHTKGQSSVIAQHPEIDYVVEGEGEKALVQILQGQKDRIIFGQPLSSEELDSISIQDLIKLSPDYFQTMRQFGRMNYISTRGCPYSCSFCASSGRLSRKSSEKVAEDLEALAKEGFTKISIQDNYFGYSPQRIGEICNEMLGRRISLDWDCQTRAESMQDESLLRLMADAGCSACYIGTENFSPEALEKMNKTRKPDDYLRMTRNAIQNMLVAGIKPYINLQVGLPYENKEIRQANMHALEELGRIAKENNSRIEIYMHLNVIYPGTPDFAALKNIPGDIFENVTKWEEENGKEIKELLRKNHFIHGAGGIPLGILNHEKLAQGKLEIDKAKLNEVNNYVDAVRGIGGIQIYKN
jgi:radical SAM superfamily enzyme YgiQ (UPF0313 family)